MFTCYVHMLCSHVFDTDKDRIFEKSLKAELAKRPHLALLNPKNLGEKNEPGILFAGRLQGYFAARKLCRLWVLKCFDTAISRGEPFVKWVDPLDETSSHDGTTVFAHFMTILYIGIHKPEISVRFDEDGALKSSSDCVRKLQNYIWAYRRVLARRCHDMLKQKYSTKAHSAKAWEPLHKWLVHPRYTKLRMARLLKFNKDDEEFFRVVGECLWRLANGDNRPWGIIVTKPRGYAIVRNYGKVFFTTAYSRDLFFFSTLTSFTHM